MKQQFLTSTINFLQKYNNYSEKEVMKLKYGLEGLYLTITKLVIILAIALILGILKEVVLVLVLFNIIRYFGFGFHAEKSSECLILSALSMIGIPYFFTKVQLSINAALLISAFSIIIFAIYAPADTIKRPLKDAKKRLIRKMLTVGTAILYVVIMYLFSNQFITNLVISSLVIEVIFINPLTYKIFRQPYNNYKNFS